SALQHPEDRFHLAVGDRVIPNVAARAPGRGEEGSQVRLRHLRPGLEVANTPAKGLRAMLGFDPGFPRFPSFLASALQAPPERSDLAAELDHALHDLAPDLRIG